MRLRHGSAWAGCVIVSLVAGCGPDAGSDPSSDLSTFESEVDAALEQESKADSPTTPIVVGEIAPGAVVSHGVAPTRRLVGWTFNAEAGATINANAALRPIPPVAAPPVAPSPPPGGPTANMVLYRRTSCLGRWERIPSASGTAIMATRLPSAGEYLLVSGATNPNASATLSASFAADSAGKVVSSDLSALSKRPFTLARSWFPADTMQRIHASGIDSFAEIKAKGAKNVARLTGVSEDALTEIARLAHWLDLPGVDYQMACSLERSGVRSPEDYYRLSYAAQSALQKQGVQIGSLPWSSTPATCDVDLALAPGQAATRPAVDWHWYGDGAGLDINDSRPWQKARGNFNCVNSANPKRDCDPRWYPASDEGWELIAYNFGGVPWVFGNKDLVGHMVFVNNRQGTLRLFALLGPEFTFNNGNGLIGSVKLVEPDDNLENPIASISFPVSPYIDGADGSEDPRTVFASAATFWTHGHGGAVLTARNWVRAELPILNDPRVYFDSAGRQRRTPLKVVIEFDNKTAATITGKFTGNGELSGQATSIQKASNPIRPDFPFKVFTAAVGGAIEYGTSAYSASESVFNALGVACTGIPTPVPGFTPSCREPWAGGAGAAAGLFLGIYNALTDHPTGLDLKVSGRINLQGELTADYVSVAPATSLYFFLNPAFPRPQDNNNANSQMKRIATAPIQEGGRAVQVCPGTRLGSIGFNPLSLPDGKSPLPAYIPYVVNECTGISKEKSGSPVMHLGRDQVRQCGNYKAQCGLINGRYVCGGIAGSPSNTGAINVELSREHEIQLGDLKATNGSPDYNLYYERTFLESVGPYPRKCTGGTPDNPEVVCSYTPGTRTIVYQGEPVGSVDPTNATYVNFPNATTTPGSKISVRWTGRLYAGRGFNNTFHDFGWAVDATKRLRRMGGCVWRVDGVVGGDRNGILNECIQVGAEQWPPR